MAASSSVRGRKYSHGLATVLRKRSSSVTGGGSAASMHRGIVQGVKMNLNLHEVYNITYSKEGKGCRVGKGAGGGSREK